VPGTASSGGVGGNEYREILAIHGAFYSIAWGTLTPLAIALSLLRGFFSFRRSLVHYSLPPEPRFLLLYDCCPVAVSAAEKASTEEDPNHFTGRIHRTVGLIIFFGLTFFQVIGGLLRPHLPEPHSSVILAVRHFGSILPSLE